MIEKEYGVAPSAGIRIIQIGIFDLDKILKELRKWFTQHYYIERFQEKNFSTKEKPLGQEIKIEWVAEKDVTSYIRYQIKATFLLREVNKVMYKNKKLEKGNFQLTIWSSLILDYKNRWQTNPINNFIFFIYNNFIIKSQIKDHKNRLEKETFNFQDISKSVLNLYK